MSRCSLTMQVIPRNCLGQCAITGAEALRHLLQKSDMSGRMALPEHVLVCAVSGKHILSDEAEPSAVTGKMVTKDLLKTSAVSGKRAEPQYFESAKSREATLSKPNSPSAKFPGRNTDWIRDCDRRFRAKPATDGNSYSAPKRSSRCCPRKPSDAR